VNKKCKNIYFKIFILFCFVLFISSCQTNSIDKEELDKENKKADSISIKLNSPELKDINKQLLENPDQPALYNKRALVYLKIKYINEAINDAKRAIKLDSTQSNFYLTLVDVYFSQNSTRLAKELLEIIEKKFPENTEALLKLAELYFFVQKYQKGIEYVNKALRIDENLAKAYFLKGSIYRESGDTSKAISSLETAIEQDNKFEDAFYDLGVIYASRKNPIAFDYYNNVIKLNPTNQTVKYARAKLLQDLGKIDEAISEYKNCIKSDANCQNCYYNLGAIYLEFKKDNQKAIEYLTKAIEVNPSFLEAYFARGYSYSLLKEKESAKADYNMCLKIQPNYELAIQALNNFR